MTGVHWFYPTPPKPAGVRVWRAYFRDRASFCFGLGEQHDAAAAAKHAAQWGDVVEVVAVT